MIAQRHDVVIVGAGLAGLRLASLLSAAGRDVAVVEARDRVGGRVFSHRFADGQWCERGAEFIDAGHDRVLALARELDLSVLDRGEPADPAAELLDVGGRVSPLAAHPAALAALAEFELRVRELPRPWDSPPGGWPADAPLADLAAARPPGRYASTLVGRAIRTEWMLPPTELSQVAIASRRPAAQRERHRIAGGNDQLATGLAARLPHPVRLATPVQRIDAGTGTVHLPGGEALQGDVVVATVPLPVLGRIWPEVPPALAAVAYGVGGKVSIQFGRRLWRDYGRNGTVFSERAWGQLWDTTDVQPGDAGVLTALPSSHDGAALLALGDRRERLLGEIERVFPGCRGLAGEMVVTDWTNDPWSLGCYSAPAPGQLADAWPLMHRPHGRLWLAGEHTDEHAGFMEGALASAERVAANDLGQ